MWVIRVRDFLVERRRSLCFFDSFSSFYWAFALVWANNVNLDQVWKDFRWHPQLNTKNLTYHPQNYTRHPSKAILSSFIIIFLLKVTIFFLNYVFTEILKNTEFLKISVSFTGNSKKPKSLKNYRIF